MNCLSLVEILLVITQQITGTYVRTCMHQLLDDETVLVLHNWNFLVAIFVSDAAEAIAFLETFLDKVR